MGIVEQRVKSCTLKAVRPLAYTCALVVAAAFIGCGGSPFEQGSPAGSDLAGAAAAAGAGSIGTGGSSLLSGAAGVAGSSLTGNTAGNGGTGGAFVAEPAGAGGALVDAPVAGGAGGDENGGAPSIGLPCDTSAWKASAFASRLEPAEPPSLAVDGSSTTRWSSGEPRAVGQWFALDLGAGVVLEQLELENAAATPDLPNSLDLQLDGKRIDVVASSEPNGLRLTFKPTRATSAKLVLTSAALNWWSIVEVGGLCQ